MCCFLSQGRLASQAQEQSSTQLLAGCLLYFPALACQVGPWHGVRLRDLGAAIRAVPGHPQVESPMPSQGSRSQRFSHQVSMSARSCFTPDRFSWSRRAWRRLGDLAEAAGGPEAAAELLPALEQHLPGLCTCTCAEVALGQTSAATTQQLALAALGAAAQASLCLARATGVQLEPPVAGSCVFQQAVGLGSCRVQQRSKCQSMHAPALVSRGPALGPLGATHPVYCATLLRQLATAQRSTPRLTGAPAAGMRAGRGRGSAEQPACPAGGPGLGWEPASAGKLPGRLGSRADGVQGGSAGHAAAPGSCPHGSCPGCSGRLASFWRGCPGCRWVPGI